MLPAVLAQVLHMSPEYVFKLVYPLVFGITSLMVYVAAKKFLSPILSFLAAGLFVSQVWYFEQMPALARQEIGLVFFGLLLLCILDTSLERARRVSIACVFIVCVVLAHYSTAYVWLLLIATVVVSRYAVELFSKRARLAGSNAKVWMVLATLLVMFLWQGPITQSSANATTILGTNMKELAGAFSPAVVKDGLQTAFHAAPSLNTDASVRAAYADAVRNRVGGPAAYYPPTTYADYSPHAVDDRSLAHDYFPTYVSSFVLLSSSLLKSIVTTLFSALGIVFIVIAFRRKKGMPRLDLALICVSSYAWLVYILFSPYIQENYNLSRLYIQLFMALAIPSIFGFWYVMKKSRRYGAPTIGVAIAIILVLSTGLLDQATGGAQRITMTQPNGNFDVFYVYDAEVAAAKWLSANRDTSYPVFADSIARLRLQSYANIDATSDVFPATILRNSYVYLSWSNVKRQHAFVDYRNYPLVYNYPVGFLTRSKDLIYSNGQSEVYR
jgi:uncharacterized membrane protein